jgi:hypothetical protein
VVVKLQGIGAAAKAIAQSIMLTLVFAGYYFAPGKFGISALFSHGRDIGPVTPTNLPLHRKVVDPSG